MRGEIIMEDKNLLLQNIDKLHTTEMGGDRIRKNLGLDNADRDGAVEFCGKIILDKNCSIYKSGKNWYCEGNGVKITVNSHSYTIITAHKIRRTEK